MQSITVATVSLRNLIGQPGAAIDDMQRWAGTAAEAGADLVLFPELNVSGYVSAPVARTFAERVPGPSTERIVGLAARLKLVIGYGILERDGASIYCTHVLVDGSGVIGAQRKIHVPTQDWAGVISSWGRVMAFVDREGNDAAMVVEELGPAELDDRRGHENFLARELRPALYQFQ